MIPDVPFSRGHVAILRCPKCSGTGTGHTLNYKVPLATCSMCKGHGYLLYPVGGSLSDCIDPSRMWSSVRKIAECNATPGGIDEVDSAEEMAVPYRGSRCGICYWALYDGDWCQNKNCAMVGKSVGKNRVHLTNEEAQILIRHNAQEHRQGTQSGDSGG